MKNWCLFVVLFLFIGCNDEEKEQEFKRINIEKYYPYIYEKYSVDSIDSSTVELLKVQICLINSIAQLNENPLFIYSPDVLKEELSKCDFDKHSLIITPPSITLNEVTDLKCNFYYNNYSGAYRCSQTLFVKSTGSSVEEDIEYIYLVINAFAVRKIPDESELTFIQGVVSHSPSN